MTWKTVRIGDLGRVVTGKTPPSSQPAMFVGDVPFFTPSDMEYDKRDLEPERHVSKDWDLRKRGLLPARSVCVVCIGATIGKVCMTSRASHTNQQVNSVVVDEKRFDAGFVYYSLRTLSDELKSKAAGAATPIINKSSFSDVTIRAPSIKTQQRIAAILGAYDDLIEVNRRRVAVLEEMAGGLYEEWFVRFRFPGHEDVPIVDTPDGPLPEGWAIRHFGELFDHTTGGLWGEEEQTAEADQHVRVIRGTDFPRLLAGQFGTVPNRFVSTKDLLKRKLAPGDIILEASGGSKDQPVGRALFVTQGLLDAFQSDVAPASFCRLLRPIKEGGLGEYVLGLLHEMYADGRIEKFQKQSTGLRNLSMKQLAVEPTVWPSHFVLQSFGMQVRPMIQAMSVHRNEIRALAASRDLLLPRLISGQLSVEAAERELENAA